MARCFVGTSGYSYGHWKGILYPEKISGSRMLTVYAEHFPVVEINYSFYHLPAEKTLQGWLERTPEDFRFILKAGKRITHNLKLVGAENELALFLARARVLGDRLGPILFQLPPSLHYDPARLESFLSLLPGDVPAAVEFRHDSWTREARTFDILRGRGAAYCIVSGPKLETRIETTAPFAYIRFHGLKGWYNYNYSEQELGEWAGHIRKIMRSGAGVYAFFNNDYKGHAVRNARTLRDMLPRNG